LYEAFDLKGNQLSIYATVWGLWKTYPTIEVYLPDILLVYLLKWFPNLSIPPLSSIRHCNVDFYNTTFDDAGNNTISVDNNDFPLAFSENA
jgi:hypothetical protein